MKITAIKCYASKNMIMHAMICYACKNLMMHVMIYIMNII